MITESVLVRDFDPMTVPPGTVSRVRWIFAESPDGAPMVIPLVVIAGTSSGETAVLTAGIHGDEYEGIVALWRLAERITPDQVHGRILIVPIAHYAAYNAATRISPIDAVNLARVFPGDPGGTITLRLADHLFSRIVRHADVLVDCHSGGVRMDFAPVAGFYQSDPQTENGITDSAARASLNTARWMGLANVWALPGRSGVLSYEAARLGIAVTGVEIGGRGGRIDAHSVMYEQGITRVLQAHGILSGDPGSQPEYTHYLDGDWALAPCAGLIENYVAVGDRVQGGAHIATIFDGAGETAAQLTAPHDGFVMGVRHLCAIQAGEWATCIVQERAF